MEEGEGGSRRCSSDRQCDYSFNARLDHNAVKLSLFGVQSPICSLKGF